MVMRLLSMKRLKLRAITFLGCLDFHMRYSCFSTIYIIPVLLLPIPLQFTYLPGSPNCNVQSQSDFENASETPGEGIRDRLNFDW